MNAKYFSDADGRYLGAFAGGAKPPAGAIERDGPPASAAAVWQGDAWVGPPPTGAEVDAERDKRLASGFDYDFGDARSVHRIGTSDGDMEKWVGEVSPIAQAYLNLGQATATVTIRTETGVVDVTATEWQHILAAAMQFRQPIYQASWDIKDDPAGIPDNIAGDPRWP